MINNHITPHPLEASSRPITEEERKIFTCLLPHYEERCNTYPASRMLKNHYDNLKARLKTYSITTIEKENYL